LGEFTVSYPRQSGSFAVWGLSEHPLLLEKSNDFSEPGLCLEITHHEGPFSSHVLRVAPHDIEISADVGG
jgi:hypothetical protein